MLDWLVDIVAWGGGDDRNIAGKEKSLTVAPVEHYKQVTHRNQFRRRAESRRRRTERPN